MASESSPAHSQRDYKIQTDGLVLTKHPVKTLKFFVMASSQHFVQLLSCILSHKLLLLAGGLTLLGWNTLYYIDGPHEQIMREASSYMKYTIWWVGLGILSSIGLGSGLHTFVLYLGPHIAIFTIKSILCGRVDLKTAPYDTALFGHQAAWEFKDCVEFGDPLFPKSLNSEHFRVPLLPILNEVHWEAILWGLGTALGELPPYFVSRAAKLSGEKLKDYEDLKMRIDNDASSNVITKYLQKLKSQMIDSFEWINFNQYRFWVILIFASVPNPLFDLAGIMCGQLLVPFWSFFIPTLIGKALVKTHIQTVLVILICNNQLVEHLESSVRQLFQHMPAVSGIVNQLLVHLGNVQHSYHKRNATSKETSSTFLLLWNVVVWIMIIGFFSSIINSTAQSYVLEKQRKDNCR